MATKSTKALNCKKVSSELRKSYVIKIKIELLQIIQDHVFADKLADYK